MKTVVFSFDDGRLDTYTNAYKILKQYNMPFTFNICSDFVERPEKYSCFLSADNKSVTKEQLIEMQNNGIEIACHGHLHLNTKEDVLNNISALKNMGIDVEDIGFASPNSELTIDNAKEIISLINEGTLSYIRSGIQVRREGLFYSILTFLERKTHSSWLFRFLNKQNVITDMNASILMSVAITNSTTVKQIVDFIASMKDGEAAILMFHSVLNKSDAGYGKDNWYFDLRAFNELCNYINANKNISVCTTKGLVLGG